MSDWDEKADDHAVAHHTYEHMPPAVNAKIYMGFVLGARWQRDQLLTDEVVERVARSINPELWHMVDKGDGAFTTAASTSLTSARAAITALLGEAGPELISLRSSLERPHSSA